MPEKLHDVRSQITGTNDAKMLVECIKLTLKCESPEEMNVWKLSLNTAVAKLNKLETEFEYSERMVSVTLTTVDVKGVLQYLKTLCQKTHFGDVKFEDVAQDMTDQWSALLRIPDEEYQSIWTVELQELSERVLYHLNTETNQFMIQWKELQMNPSIIVDSFSISPADLSNAEDTRVCVCISVSEEFWVWNALMKTAFALLEIPDFAYKTNSWDNVHYVSLTVDMKHVHVVLEFLQPLTQKARFETVNFTSTDPDSIQSCSEFIESGSLRCLIYDPFLQRNAHHKSLLDFAAKVRPEVVDYNRITQTNDIIDFLIPLADLVEAINIWELDTFTNPLVAIPFAAVKDMLNGKCKYLAIRGDVTYLSLAEAELLLKSFHHNKKRSALKMWTAYMPTPVNIQMGEYKLEVVRNSLLLEHLGMNPRLEDKLIDL